MRIVCLFYFGSFILSCSSEFDGYPPSHDGTDYVGEVLAFEEGNYTENPQYLFSIRASVRNSNLHVIINKSMSEETSDMIFLNNTQNGNRVTCEVYFNSVVDRERTQDLTFKLFARSSSADAPLRDIFETVYILDINDESPVFGAPSYQVNIPENHIEDTDVETTIKATDPDNGEGGRVTYSIEPSGQAPNLYDGYFDIHLKDERVVLHLKKKLDYEKLTFLQYNVIATDGGSHPLHNTSVELLVKVQDVQDKPPVFVGIPYVETVKEDIHGCICQAEAVDGDLGLRNEVKFGQLSGPCADLLNISESSGEICVKEGSSLDRDNGTISDVLGVCFITIEAFEGNGSVKSNLTHSNTTFALTIEDINDNAPTFMNCYTNYIGSVPENATEVSISFNNSIVVQDMDQNGYNTIHLEVQYHNMTPYSGIQASPTTLIGKGIVLLRVKHPFDYEEQTVEDFVIRATDTKNSSLTSTCQVQVHIIDINDNDPVFQSQEYIFNVSENSCNGTHVGYIKAIDKDSGEFGDVFYQFSGTDRRFAVNRSSGEVYVATNHNCYCSNKHVSCEDSELNREKNSVYYLTAVAQDGGGKRTPVSVEIRITDTNDNHPRFRDSSYETSIKENSRNFSSGTPQFTLEANDDDLEGSENSNISLCFVDVSDDNCTKHPHFNISDRGIIMCIKALDYENISNASNEGTGELHLKIKAYDHGSPSLYSVVNLTIYVQDVNDKEPVFNTSYSSSVEENSLLGTHVLTVSAYDADGTAPNNEMSYFIFSGGSDQFNLDGNSGNVTVQIGANLDRETVSNYTLTIIAIDRGNPQMTGTTNVTVWITDVNDSPPTFLNLPNETTVKENETLSQHDFIFSILCFDEDTDSDLTYRIDVADIYFGNRHLNVSEIPGVQNYFEVTAKGEIKSSPNIDAELVTKVVLNVTVVDINTTSTHKNSSSALLTLNIVDCNDNPPIFTKKALSTGILRTSAINTEVIDLKEYVTDGDFSEQNRIHRYKLNSTSTKLVFSNVQNMCDSPFCVSVNGTVHSNVLLSKKGYLELKITVRDDAGVDITQLEIYVIDESQQLSMHFQRQKNEAYQDKDKVLEELSRELGFKCVFDKIEPYTDEDGGIKEFESLLTFHVLDEPRKKVLDATYVESILDKRGDSLQNLRNQYAVKSIGALQIRSLNSNENKIKETYILVAVIVLLTVILGIVIYFYIISTTRFKRRLKAATIPTVSVSEKNENSLGGPFIPGSNIFSKDKNPLVDKEEEVKKINDLERISLAGSENSLDNNDVEYAKRYHDNDNPIEEKEVTMDLFGDDGQFLGDMNDDSILLNKVLQQHAQTDPVVKNGVPGSEQQDTGRINESYEIVESTDV